MRTLLTAVVVCAVGVFGLVASVRAGCATDLPVTQNLYAWYDANSLSGMPDGSAVTAWSNCGGIAAFDLVSLSATPPTYSATGHNGGPAVHFTLGSPMGTVQNFGLGGDPAFTVIFSGTVAQLSGTRFTCPWAWGNPTGYAGSAAAFEVDLENGPPRVDFATAFHMDANTPDASFAGRLNTPVVVSIRRTPGPLDTNTQIRIDATAQMITGSTGIPNIVDSPFFIGPTAPDYVTCSPVMDVGQVLVYDRSLTTPELDLLYAYLTRTCGSVISYSSGCPGNGGFVPSLSVGCAAVGQPLGIEIANVEGGARVALMLSSAAGTTNLPNGCIIDVNFPPVWVYLGPIGGSGPGAGSSSPNFTPGRALTFYMQVLALDSAVGKVTSNALEITINP